MIPFLVNQISDIIVIVVDRARNFEKILQANGLQQMIRDIRMYDYIKTFGIDLAHPKYIQQIQTVLQNNISAIVSFSSSYAKDAGGIVVNTV